MVVCVCVGKAWNQREKELQEGNRRALDNLQNKLSDAHNVLKEHDEAAALERVGMQEQHRKAVEVLRIELQEAKSALLNARAEKRKALVAQESDLRSDYDKRIQQLKADLRGKEQSVTTSLVRAPDGHCCCCIGMQHVVVLQDIHNTCVCTLKQSLVWVISTWPLPKRNIVRNIPFNNAHHPFHHVRARRGWDAPRRWVAAVSLRTAMRRTCDSTPPTPRLAC